LHFLARGGRLDCVTHMRSQSAFKILPSDIFVLTMLHEAVAVAAGVELGRY
jgi:thymidylate synthase